MRRAVTRVAPRRRLSVRVGRVDKHIAVVTLDRPEKLNALDMAAFRGVRDAALKLRDDASVRCVVLRGAGRAFCAGLDVKGVMHPLRAKANCAELLERADGEAANLAQAVLCCAFAAADIAVAIAAVRPSELRLSAGNAMLTVGEASHY